MVELWKDIIGYEGLYQVSRYGKVRNKRCKILKVGVATNGYNHVTLCKDNVKKTTSIHKLVATHFIDNPNNLPQINHKDENKNNNKVDNLEWCTLQYNIEYSFSKRVIQLDLENNIIKIWESAMECGRHGFNQGKVSECCRGEKSTHKKYKWILEEDYYNGKEIIG